MSEMAGENDMGASAYRSVGDYFNTMPFNSRHLAMGSILFFAFIIEAWEMMIIIFVSDSIAAEFNLSAVQVGSLIGSIYLGMIVGAYAWGIMSDKIGRKKTIIYSLVLYSIFSLLSSFSGNFEILYFLRFMAGVSLAGMLVTMFPYFEELLPVKQRGKASGYLSSGWPFGVLIGVAVTAMFLQNNSALSGWRVVIFLSSLSGLWAILLAKVPESPYWLVGKGKQAEAKKVIKYLSNDQIDIDEKTTLHVLNMQQGNIFQIFNRKLLLVTCMQTVINFTLAFGYWGLYTWLPTLLQQKGLSLSQSLGFIALSSVMQIPGYISASHLTATYGRKKILFVYVLGATISGFMFAFSANSFQLYLYSFILAFFNQGAWAVWNTWFAEVYPTNVRASGYSFGAASQRWANTFAPTIIGIVVALGWPFVATVSFIELFLVVTLISLFFLPETEGYILN